MSGHGRFPGIGREGACVARKDVIIGILPVVSIVVPFWGYLLGSFILNMVKPKTGTTMETIGSMGLGFRAL